MSVPEQWVELARYDLGTAKDMLAAKRHRYVLFFCQQAVEKALKGIIAQRTNEMPPRLHNLPTLAERAELELNDPQLSLITLLTRWYILGRYPGEMRRVPDDVDVERALRDTEELVEWLLSLMP